MRFIRRYAAGAELPASVGVPLATGKRTASYRPGALNVVSRLFMARALVVPVDRCKMWFCALGRYSMAHYGKHYTASNTGVTLG